MTMGIFTTFVRRPELYVDLQDPECGVWHMALRHGQLTRCTKTTEGLTARRVDSRPAPPEELCAECWIMP
jgi:hypothetical protein